MSDLQESKLPLDAAKRAALEAYSDISGTVNTEALFAAVEAAIKTTQQPKDAPEGPVSQQIWRAVLEYARLSHESWNGHYALNERDPEAWNRCLAAILNAREPHDVCENSRDCIICGKRIEPAGGVCFRCTHDNAVRSAQQAEGPSKNPRNHADNPDHQKTIHNE